MLENEEQQGWRRVQPCEECLGELEFSGLEMYFWNSSCSALFNHFFCVQSFVESSDGRICADL